MGAKILNNLKLCFWNIGGLKSRYHDKSQDPQFINEIKGYDTVLLSETHTGYNNQVSFPNFHYFPVCRERSNNGRCFGGWVYYINPTSNRE